MKHDKANSEGHLRWRFMEWREVEFYTADNYISSY